MPATLCIINQKGGSGKSSTCFHVGGTFARQGLKVLLVDADPQGSLSQGFCGSAVVESLTRAETHNVLSQKKALLKSSAEAI